MTDLVADIVESANWISEALNSSGYVADFSVASLKEVDRFFDEHTLNGAARPGGLLGESFGQRMFSIGSYIGETLRRNVGGEWKPAKANPDDEINVELHLPDGSTVWPIQRAMKRLKNGAEDGIYAYGAALGLK